MKPTYPLKQLYFYLTRGCNLACRHCWISPSFQGEGRSFPELSVDLFCSIIEQARAMGVSAVKLTGGEPLLHSRIIELIRRIREEKMVLTVETNGVLCSPELAREISAGREPFVSVSLDGATAGTHEWVRGVAGSFDAAVKGIRNLVAVGVRPQVIMTIMKRNRDEMELLVRLAERLGAGSVKFNVLEPTARGEKMHEAGEGLALRELVELGDWVENSLSAATKLPLSFSHPAAFRSLGRMFGKKGDGCSVCGILGILGVLADGSYALCGIGETVPELVFGHSAHDRLEEVWQKNPVLQDLRQGLPHRFEGICGQCLMKNFCLGSCVAQNYYRSKSLWAGFWYCEEAHKEGLFPETRLSLSLPSPLAGEGFVMSSLRSELRGEDSRTGRVGGKKD
jgi:SynChlorMet cassette radical SAM/SPASM protein ScmF